ncbi:MAG: hypothetical protein IKM82_07460 [Oscillospiraceae bacterium]|nr:hypothetical protein [Oscillospiraceae bacterium]
MKKGKQADSGRSACFPFAERPVLRAENRNALAPFTRLRYNRAEPGRKGGVPVGGKTRQLAISALLITADVILTRLLALNTAVMKIGLGFAAVAICAMLYGPLWAVIPSDEPDSEQFFSNYTETEVLTTIPNIFSNMILKSDILPSTFVLLNCENKNLYLYFY